MTRQKQKIIERLWMNDKPAQMLKDPNSKHKRWTVEAETPHVFSMAENDDKNISSSIVIRSNTKKDAP